MHVEHVGLSQYLHGCAIVVVVRFVVLLFDAAVCCCFDCDDCDISCDMQMD